MTLPYKFYFFGSEDSTDTDVIIEVDKINEPHEDIAFINKLKLDYNLDWDITLVLINEGKIVDTISRKGSPDSVNNCLFYTYDLHRNRQKYPNPINQLVERNILLAAFRCIRNILYFCSRTSYRPMIKKVLTKEYYNSSNLSFQDFVCVLKNIDFATIDTFNKKYSDEDIWKKIAFFLGQTLSLILDNKEIYTKNQLIEKYPKLTPFIHRNVDNYQKEEINALKYIITDIMSNFNVELIEKRILKFNNEIIDVELEKIFNNGK
ncbi:MAG: hypothetical protein WCO63_11365 [Bacteroidota bacterium]